MNGRKKAKGGFVTPWGEVRKAPHLYSADDLHEFLVGDAARRYATPLDWAIRAYEVIAKKRKQSTEDAYQAVRADLATRVELPLMPVG